MKERNVTDVSLKKRTVTLVMLVMLCIRLCSYSNSKGSRAESFQKCISTVRLCVKGEGVLIVVFVLGLKMMIFLDLTSDFRLSQKHIDCLPQMPLAGSQREISDGERSRRVLMQGNKKIITLL